MVDAFIDDKTRFAEDPYQSDHLKLTALQNNDVFSVLNPDSPSLDEIDDSDLTNEALEEGLEDNDLDIVRMYLKEAGSKPLLNLKEEQSLSQKIQTGQSAQLTLAETNILNKEKILHYRSQIKQGEAAKKELTESNLRLVISVAKKYRSMGILSFLDSIQEGNIGLMRAAEKYKGEKGFRFSTYASWWIRQAITRAMADLGRTIRLPVHQFEFIGKIQKVSRELGPGCTEQEIAAVMGVPVEKIITSLAQARNTTSLEMEVGEDGSGELVDLLEDGNALSPPSETISNLTSEAVRKAVSKLTKREKAVVCLRFGLIPKEKVILKAGQEPVDFSTIALTLDEVGKVFGVTRERIRQIEVKALGKLDRNDLKRLWED